MAEQLQCRQEDLEKFVSGIQRFCVGLAKKVLLANAVGKLWDVFLATDTAELTVLGGWLGLPPALAACLGYAAVFGAATNTLAAPVLLCVELFGGDLLPYAAIVCITAYLFNFGHSVYAQAVREGVARTAVRPARSKKKMLPLPERLD